MNGQVKRGSVVRLVGCLVVLGAIFVIMIILAFLGVLADALVPLTILSILAVIIAGFIENNKHKRKRP